MEFIQAMYTAYRAAYFTDAPEDVREFTDELLRISQGLRGVL